jgi:hypothetical protein
MPANRHRYEQKFPLVYIVIGVVMAVCLAGFAVKGLLVQHQNVQSAQRIKRLNKELQEIEIKNEAFRTRRDQLISPPALAKAIKEGFVKVVPIEEKFVIQVGAPKHRVATANPQPARGGAR